MKIINKVLSKVGRFDKIRVMATYEGGCSWKWGFKPAAHFDPCTWAPQQFDMIIFWRKCNFSVRI